MPKATLYSYNKCSTCRKAIAWLEDHNWELKVMDITLEPPSITRLKKLLKACGKRNKLINTSGQVYRSPGMKEKLAAMSDAQLLEALHANGKLCKRPMLFTSDGNASAGFCPDVWENW